MIILIATAILLAGISPPTFAEPRLTWKGKCGGLNESHDSQITPQADGSHYSRPPAPIVKLYE